MNLSRRKFATALGLSGLAPAALSQTADEPTDLGMKIMDVKVSGKRDKQIRDALRNTNKQVAAIRAYRLKRDTPPALSLGVFDA